MQLIGPDDKRWLDFGFDIPSALPTPEAPTGLRAQAGLPGHIGMAWENSAWTEYCHVFKELLDPPGDPEMARKVTDPTVDLNTFQSGQRVRLWVTALNRSGESLPSEPVEILVP